MPSATGRRAIISLPVAGKIGELLVSGRIRSMRKIRIHFCDFAADFSKTNNYYLLSERFELELCGQPDIRFCRGRLLDFFKKIFTRKIFSLWPLDCPKTPSLASRRAPQRS
jgi:hypothetical protein